MSQVRAYALDAVKMDGMKDPSEGDLAVIAGPDYAGMDVTSDDVHIRRMLLCHDQYDRTGERFPLAYLRRFTETIPGKSVMAMHDTGGFCGGGSLPMARFFTADIDRRSEDAFPVLVTSPDLQREDMAQPAGGPIPGFMPKRTRVQYLSCGFYFENDPATDAMRKRIDLGVYKHVSIGFRYDDLTCDICKKSYLGPDCSHLLMRYYEDANRICTGTYSGDTEQVEALEGSVVYLGAQPRARLVKALRNREPIDPKAYAMTPFGEDLVALKEVEEAARHYGHQQKAWAFPAAAKAWVESNEPPPPAESADDTLDFEDAAEAVDPSTDPAPAPSAELNADPPGGEAFEAQLAAALGAVLDCKVRAEAVLALREQKGSRFSRSRYEQIRALSDEMIGLSDLLQTKSESTSGRLVALKLRALAEEHAIR